MVGLPFDPSDYVKKGAKPLQFKCENYKGLWDTGASKSVIKEEIAESLALPNIGCQYISTANGISLANTHFISLWLPNRFTFSNLLVTSSDLGNNIDLLIGMDIINQGDFAINNKNKKTSVTFRIPSMDKINYVKQTRQLPSRPGKVGRNDKCPCGSGKKYKKCHGP